MSCIDFRDSSVLKGPDFEKKLYCIDDNLQIQLEELAPTLLGLNQIHLRIYEIRIFQTISLPSFLITRRRSKFSVTLWRKRRSKRKLSSVDSSPPY